MNYVAVFKSGARLEVDLSEEDVERLKAALTRHPKGVFATDTVGISIPELAGYAPLSERPIKNL